MLHLGMTLGLEWRLSRWSRILLSFWRHPLIWWEEGRHWRQGRTICPALFISYWVSISCGWWWRLTMASEAVWRLSKSHILDEGRRLQQKGRTSSFGVRDSPLEEVRTRRRFGARQTFIVLEASQLDRPAGRTALFVLFGS